MPNFLLGDLPLPQAPGFSLGPVTANPNLMAQGSGMRARANSAVQPVSWREIFLRATGVNPDENGITEQDALRIFQQMRFKGMLATPGIRG